MGKLSSTSGYCHVDVSCDVSNALMRSHGWVGLGRKKEK